jgi:hypothetical protein
MSEETINFLVIPFNSWPSELAQDSTPQKVEEEKKFIRERILPKGNPALVKEKDAMLLSTGRART